MTSKAVVSLTTGLEDPEKVTVAFLVAVGAAESGQKSQLIDGADLGGTVPMWQWIGDEGATTFSY